MANKIAIGIPTGGTMKSKTAFSFIEMIRLNKDLEMMPMMLYGNFAAENKEKIVRIAQDNLCSHLLLADCDMVFPPDILPRLLAHDKDIVGVDYNYRRVPLQTVTKFFGKNGEPITEYPERMEDLMEVAAAGTGLILIRMSVFSELESPYFPMYQDKEGNFILTEDVGFCEKARDKGFKVHIDTTIKIGHQGDYIY